MGSGAQRGEDRVALRSTLPVVLGLAIASLALRVLDLDYNGPFIDESFHAVVAAYGNVPHLTGDVLLYPQLSRLVHAHYGLVGARALSAVFGALTVACVFGIAAIVARRFVSDDAVVYVATGAAGLFAVSAPPLFVSQFANYYALSFLLFAFGCWATLRWRGPSGHRWWPPARPDTCCSASCRSRSGSSRRERPGVESARRAPPSGSPLPARFSPTPPGITRTSSRRSDTRSNREPVSGARAPYRSAGSCCAKHSDARRL